MDHVGIDDRSLEVFYLITFGVDVNSHLGAPLSDCLRPVSLA